MIFVCLSYEDSSSVFFYSFMGNLAELIWLESDDPKELLLFARFLDADDFLEAFADYYNIGVFSRKFRAHQVPKNCAKCSLRLLTPVIDG